MAGARGEIPRTKPVSRTDRSRMRTYYNPSFRTQLGRLGWETDEREVRKLIAELARQTKNRQVPVYSTDTDPDTGATPSLTPAQLQEVHRRSGRIGGRPRKPTVEEARQAALEELIPKSLQVLRAHLGEGDSVNPEAWRAALRVFEHAYGRAGRAGPRNSRGCAGNPRDELARDASPCRAIQPRPRDCRGRADHDRGRGGHRASTHGGLTRGVRKLCPRGRNPCVAANKSASRAQVTDLSPRARFCTHRARSDPLSTARVQFRFAQAGPTETLSTSGIAPPGMEHLWSQAGATGGNPLQMGRARKRLKQAY